MKRNETTDMQATIYLGASSISMMIAQHHPNTPLVELDQLSRPLDLATEIFRSGKLSRDTINQCVKIISDYQNLIAEYQLAGPIKVELIGSNIMKDVQNIDTVTNRLHISSKIKLRVMDDGEMTRVLYLQTKEALKQHQELNDKKVLVVHLGPGNTRIFILKNGRLKFYTRYRMGSTRMAESLQLGTASHNVDEDKALILNTIKPTVEQIAYECKEDAHYNNFDTILLLTPEFKDIHNLTPQGSIITPQQLKERINHITSLSIARRIEHYRMDYANVSTLLPCALFYKQIADTFTADKILINVHEKNGNPMRYIAPSHEHQEELKAETLHFSELLAQRYNVDQEQSTQVADYCTILFEQLQALHQLDSHDKLLLQTAATLYKVGTYINPKQYHQHSQYIILNSELFGLSLLDVAIVGMLARYHRHGAPTLSKRSYAELEEKDRLRVQKLAAIIRVADALSSGRNKHIKNLSIRIKKKRIELVLNRIQDLTIENLALSKKADLFTDIFGYELALVSGI